MFSFLLLQAQLLSHIVSLLLIFNIFFIFMFGNFSWGTCGWWSWSSCFLCLYFNLYNLCFHCHWKWRHLHWCSLFWCSISLAFYLSSSFSFLQLFFAHYFLSCAYMDSWLYPSLFIIFTFVATIPSFHIHCFCLLIVITRILDLPYLFCSSCSSLFCTCKRFRSSFFIHSIHLYCETFPLFMFIVYAFVLCLQELLTLPPFFFVLCLQKLSFFLFITFIYLYL